MPTLPRDQPRFSGDEYRAIRERMKLTQPMLAKLLGVSPTTIGNWERCTYVPTVPMMALLYLYRVDEISGTLRPLPTARS